MAEPSRRPNTGRFGFLGVLLARRGRVATRYLAALAGLLLTMATCLLFGLHAYLALASDKGNARAIDWDRVDPAGCMVATEAYDPYGEQTYSRVILARPEEQACIHPPAPPGLERFPEPGEVFVSPELAALRESDVGMARRLPQVDGLISSEGLVASNELRVVVGADFDALGQWNQYRYAGFGADRDWVTTYLRTEPGQLRAFGVLLCLPIALWLIYTATLVGARLRERQFGVLAVIGLDARATCTALVIESTIAVGVGSIVGAAASAVLLSRWTPTFAGLRAFPGDYSLSPPTMVLAAALTAGAGVVATTIAAMRFVRSRSERSPVVVPSPVALALVLSGATFGVASIASGTLRRHETVSNLAQIATVVGLVLIVPLVARALGRALSSSSPPQISVIGRRLAAPSGSLVRAAAAMTAGLFIVLLAGTIADDAVTDPQAIANDVARDGTNLLTVSYPNSEAVNILSTYDVLTGRRSDDPSLPTVLYGSCEALLAAVGATDGCDPGVVDYSSLDPGQRELVEADVGGPVTGHAPDGPRAGALSGYVVDTAGRPSSSSGPDVVVAVVPAGYVDDVIDRVIGSDPAVSVDLDGQAWVAGIWEGNRIIDIVRWAGYFAIVASIVTSAIGVIALAHDRQRSTRYLEVLGVTRVGALGSIVGEIVITSAACAVPAVIAAWIWGAVDAANRVTGRTSILAMALTAAVALVAQAAVCAVAVADAARSSPSVTLDGDVDMLANLRPYAKRP